MSKMLLFLKIYLRQGLRSGSQNCGKKSKIHHFLEIVQYTSNTTFPYQNVMRNPPPPKKINK